MGMLKAVSKSAKAAFDEVHGYGKAGNDAVCARREDGSLPAAPSTAEQERRRDKGSEPKKRAIADAGAAACEQTGEKDARGCLNGGERAARDALRDEHGASRVRPMAAASLRRASMGCVAAIG